MAATMLLRLSSIGVTAIVARIVDPHTFGIFAVASTVFIIISALGEFGVSSCLARADLDLDALAPTMVSVSLVTSAVLAAVMVIYARPIAAALGAADAAGPVRVMAITVVLVGIFATPSAQCVRDFKQDKIFFANAISIVPSTALLLLLAEMGSGAMAFAWSRALGQLVAGSIVFYYTKKRYRPGVSRAALTVLFTFGIPLAAASFVSYILQNVDYALIGRLMGTVALGTYVLAFNTASWSTTLLSGVMAGVSMPAFSRVKNDAVLLENAMVFGTRVVALIAVPMCTLVVVLAHPIILTIYGSKWSEAATVLPALAVYGAISVLCLYFSSILSALGKSKVILGTQLLWLFALAIAMWVGVHRYGIEGAATAHVIVVTLIILPCFLVALRRAVSIRITALLKGVVPILFAGLLCAAVAWLVMIRFSNPVIEVLTGGAAGSITYLILVFPQAITLFGNDLLQTGRLSRILRVYSALGVTISVAGGSSAQTSVSPLTDGRDAMRGEFRLFRQEASVSNIELATEAMTASVPGVQKNKIDCEIVVISYNSAQYIDDLLDSIPLATTGLRTRCTVIDNDSQDGTQYKVRFRPNVRLIEAGGNLGYSGAINLARSSIGPCSSLLIVNPDLVLEPDSVTNLFRTLKAENAGVAYPMMCDLDGSLYFSLRREPNLRTAFGDALFGEHWPSRPGWLSDVVRDRRAYQKPHAIDWGSGAAMLISERCNAAVGKWDSATFFLYAEETDFALRARNLGFRMYYEPTARVRHESGGSGRSLALYMLMHVNRIRYYEKHHSRLACFIFRGITYFHHLLRVADPDMRATLRVVTRRSSWGELPHGSTSSGKAEVGT